MTTTPTPILKTHLLAIAEFVSTDETRASLCGVWLTRQDGHLVLMATDGRKMAVLHTGKPAAEEADDIFVPSRLIEAIASEQDPPELLISRSDAHTIVRHGLLRLEIHANESIPGWEKIIPKTVPETCAFTWMHMGYLAAAHKLAEKLGMGHAIKMGAELDSDPMLTPMLIWTPTWTPQRKGLRLMIAIMPMNIPDEYQK